MNCEGPPKGHREPQPSSLGHVPTGKWQFDEGVTEVFDDMLARSIPQIAGMRDAVLETGKRFVQPKTFIVDLGCARGDAIAPFIKLFATVNRFLGIEMSAPMLRACRERFEAEHTKGLVDIRSEDLRSGYPTVQASLTLCVLTLMFLPVEHRQRVLEDAFRQTVSGGAFVLVEKIIGSDSVMDNLLRELYFEQKRRNGYSQSEIDRKRAALEGVLVPLSATWNEQLLRGAGFAHVECFWRCFNFCGWVAVKE